MHFVNAVLNPLMTENRQLESAKMQPHKSGVGTKANPSSAFSVGEYSSPEELSRMGFSSSQSVDLLLQNMIIPSTVIGENKKKISSTSNQIPRHVSGEGTSLAKPLLSFLSDGTSIPILRTNAPREGRANQRWDKCPTTNNIIRLATGCVPITNDGRIIFISSAKKKEWILPKGGWETDEKIEESAARETYEEAGVIGTLFPKLEDVTFETRKEKKRRSDHEAEMIRCANTPQAKDVDSNSPTVRSVSVTDSPTRPLSANSDDNRAPLSPSVPLPVVRVTFFPLYVSEVLLDWPESGRSRKVFTIDEAINIVTRQELKDVLLEVKRRNLHKFDFRRDYPHMVSESEA